MTSYTYNAIEKHFLRDSVDYFSSGCLKHEANTNNSFQNSPNPGDHNIRSISWDQTILKLIVSVFAIFELDFDAFLLIFSSCRQQPTSWLQSTICLCVSSSSINEPWVRPCDRLPPSLGLQHPRVIHWFECRLSCISSWYPQQCSYSSCYRWSDGSRAWWQCGVEPSAPGHKHDGVMTSELRQRLSKNSFRSFFLFLL